MKKQFFHIVAALALICGVFAFSGCTDFEKDINDLTDRIEALETGKIADLENQVKTLQDALNSAQGAIDAIEALGIDGLKDQLDALQGVIDGINLDDYATKDYVDGTFATKDAVKKLEEALGALEGRVEALEGMLSEENIKAILDQIKGAQEDATEALGLIKSLQEALGVYAEAGKLQAALDGKLDIEDFDAKFEEALKAALANDGEVSGDIAKAIQDAVDKVKVLFSQRLTSISLIPTAYYEGIPAISFNSYKYIAKTVTSNAKEEGYTDVKNAAETIITGQAVNVDYHISPSNITKEDIQNPEYLIQGAELLKSAGPDFELNVTNYSITDDVLTVSVRRTAGSSLNVVYDEKGNVVPNHIYTAALKVPIAEKNLVEGETEANVYSEYSVLREDNVTPYIAALPYTCVATKTQPAKINHYYKDYAAAKAGAVNKEVAYNATLDLLTLVTGCEGKPEAGTGHKEITKDVLRANGLAFRFGLPVLPYTLGVNSTDQQQFAKLDGHTLISKIPNGTTNNAAAIDKTPIVRVELTDTVNNQIVDVRYLKIKWIPVPVIADDEDLGLIHTFTDALGCDDFNGKIDWKTFVNEILSKVNDGKGVSYNDFVENYNNVEYKTDYDIDPNRTERVVSITWDPTTAGGDAYDEHAAALTWNMNAFEIGALIDGKNAADLKSGDKLKTFTIELTFKSKESYNGDVKVKLAVDEVVPVLPELVGLVTPEWLADGELARVFPVQYKSHDAQTEVTYNYNMNALFRSNNNGFMINNVEPLGVRSTDYDCRAWSFQFAADQMNLYTPGFNPGRSAFRYADEDAENARQGYLLYAPGLHADKNLAAYITYDANADNADYVNWHQEAHKSVALRLMGDEVNGVWKGREQAINLLEDKNLKPEEFKNRITINAWGRINPYNHVIVKTFDVVFIKPLYVADNNTTQFFEDGYEGGRVVKVAELFKAADAWDYPVSVYDLPEKDSKGNEIQANIDANGRKAYYGVETPEFDLRSARISMKLDGNNLVPIEDPADLTDAQIQNLPKLSDYQKSTLKLDDAKENLTLTSISGWRLEKLVYIYVSVDVEHKWGKETIWVHIPVYPHGTAPATK